MITYPKDGPSLLGKCFRAGATLAILGVALTSCLGPTKVKSSSAPTTVVNGRTLSTTSSTSNIVVLPGPPSTTLTSSPSIAPPPLVALPNITPGPPGTVLLSAFNANGSLISWGNFRSIESNNTGSNGYDDALLNPKTLEVEDLGPLYNQGIGVSAALDATGYESLSLAWPSDLGYSNLICDLPGAGQYNFDQVCSLSLLRDVSEILSEHKGMTLTLGQASTFNSIASQLLKPAGGSFNQNQLQAAMDLDVSVTSDAGLYQISTVGLANNYRYGVTIDSPAIAITTLRSLKSIYPTGARVRLVIDPGTPLSRYQSIINFAHSLGISVMVELVDSQYMASMNLANYEARVSQIVTTLRNVDSYEIGNEVNGNWLGTNVAAKVAYAISFVRSHSSATTLLTLYWQLGEDTASNSIFNWFATNITNSELSGINDIGISLYPQEAPMGTAFHRVLDTLHSQFAPGQRIFITELGYGGSGVTGSWWWVSPGVASDSQRAAVASLYQDELAGFSFSGGGTFWWYFGEEYKSNLGLDSALANFYQLSHPKAP
ncbi:hypothetical protein [Acidithrix sp. C25]|uniref:hypothetical protein n=1 Tax=Acidithrix sp. C25 TaxID=1671482 RepID=UPI00191BAAC5|nr:hypothetical protein [Acidithrix sp. C25]